VKLHLSVEINAPVTDVWAYLEPLERHTDWMADAVEIRFHTDQHRGVGTVYDCVTKVGPLTTVDRMTCVEWDEGKAMGIRHQGLVTGTGRFSLTPIDDGTRTRFDWDEDLRFPWQFGGALGERVAKPIFLRLWRGNLERLAAHFD